MQIELEEIKPFRFKMFTYIWPEHEKYRQSIMDYIDECSEKKEDVHQNYAVNLKQKLFESEFNFLTSSNPSVEKLHEFLCISSSKVLGDYNHLGFTDEHDYAQIIKESWCHRTEKYGIHDYHLHPNCSWGLIYCVDPGDSSTENGGVNTFQLFHPGAMYDDGLTAYMYGENCFFTPHWHVPEAGQVLLFPTFLYHNASLYKGDKVRYIIGANLTMNVNKVIFRPHETRYD